jgi:hypothetical protein
MKNNMDAEDVLQEAFIKAWNNCEYLEKDESLPAWLTRIVINECNNIFRNRIPVHQIDNQRKKYPAGDLLRLTLCSSPGERIFYIIPAGADNKILFFRIHQNLHIFHRRRLFDTRAIKGYFIITYRY